MAKAIQIIYSSIGFGIAFLLILQETSGSGGLRKSGAPSDLGAAMILVLVTICLLVINRYLKNENNIYARVFRGCLVATPILFLIISVISWYIPVLARGSGYAGIVLIVGLLAGVVGLTKHATKKDKNEDSVVSIERK
jgi:hypothetical protein